MDMDYQKDYIEKNPTLHVEDAPDKFKQLRSEISKIKGVTSILDVGSGAGVLTKMFDDYVKPEKIVGVDISEHMVKVARKQKSNISFRCVDIFKYKTREYFDLIICADIVEHVKDDKKLLKKLASMGENIVVRVPMEDSAANSLLKRLGIIDVNKMAEEQYGHIHHYNTRSFKTLVENSGLKIVHFTPFLISNRRTLWFNEIIRQVTSIIGIFSMTTAVNFGGGFIVARIKNSDTEN